MGVLRTIYGANDLHLAKKAMNNGILYPFQNFFHHFGFTEGFRNESDNEKYGDQSLPVSECTADRMADAGWALAGTNSDIR